MPEPQFYEVDSTRIPLGELLRGSKNLSQALLLLVVAPIARITRRRLPAISETINARDLAPFHVGADGFDADAAEQFETLGGQLAAVGYTPAAFYRVQEPTVSAVYHLAAYRSGDGRSIALVQLRGWYFEHPPRLTTSVSFVSRLTDGTLLRTTSTRPDLFSTPGVTTHHFRDMPADELSRRHEEALAGLLPTDIASDNQAAGLAEELHAAERRYSVERGIFREVDASPTGRAGIVLDRPYDTSPNVAVLRELIKLDRKRWSPASGLFVLLITVALFIAAGSVAWSWRFALIVVAVLFVHEMGHFMAMKLFGYRNVKMFFIPFLGAAVSGRAVGVAAWKKLVVYLAGPLPGIVIGLAAGVGALLNDQPWLGELALIAVVLNALNLLPILPLDGGRVVETTLTARHPMADLSFRVLTVGVLAVVYLAVQDWVLFGLGLLIAAGIPQAFKMAKLAAELRRAGPLPYADDGHTVPLPAADLIATRVKQAVPRGLNATTAAKYVQMTYERVNERPPGVGATLGFLALQGGTLAAVLLAGLIFLLVHEYQQGGLGYDEDLFAYDDAPPAHAYDPTRIYRWPAADPPPTYSGKPLTLVATFFSDEQAQSAGDALAAQSPGGPVLLRLGPVLLAELPPDSGLRAPWVEQLEALADRVVVDSELLRVTFDLRCVAPSEEAAWQLENLIGQARTLVNGDPLTPPWHPTRPPSEDVAKARRTYAYLNRTMSTMDEQPVPYEEPVEAQRLNTLIEQAQRRGDRGTHERLSKELTAFYERQRAEHRASVLAHGPDEIDPAVIELYAEQPIYDWDADYDAQREADHEKAWDIWLQKINPHLGPMNTDDPYRGVAMLSGYAGRDGLLLEMQYVSFERPAVGLPRLLDWLGEQGCTGILFEEAEPGYFDEFDF